MKRREPDQRSKKDRNGAKKRSIVKGLKTAQASAELESLERRAAELEKAADAVEDRGPSKRDIATSAAWVAPIMLAVNLPSAVFAAPAVSPVAAPTAAPTSAPTTPPTTVPTASPTSS
jgi:hypothetical protein